MKYKDNPQSIKFYVKKYLLSNADRFKDKKVIGFLPGMVLLQKY
jgi:hypothetical protein